MTSPSQHQILPEESIPHQPPNLNEQRKLGLRTWQTLLLVYWGAWLIIGLGMWLNDNLNRNEYALFLGAAICVAASLFLLYLGVQFDQYLRQSRWKKLDLQQREREFQASQTKAREAEQLSTHLTMILDTSREALLTLPQYLSNALGWLHTARREYANNAFDPFWTAVENASKDIGAFNDAVRLLSQNGHIYYAELEGKRHTFPPFSVHSESLPDPSGALDELRHVVRLGQTNFQFANIWEHRKTRGVIIAGFKTLGDAVDNLAHVVENQMSILRDTIHSDLARTLEEQIKLRETAETQVQEQARVHEVAQELHKISTEVRDATRRQNP